MKQRAAGRAASHFSSSRRSARRNFSTPSTPVFPSANLHTLTAAPSQQLLLQLATTSYYLQPGIKQRSGAQNQTKHREAELRALKEPHEGRRGPAPCSLASCTAAVCGHNVVKASRHLHVWHQLHVLRLERLLPGPNTSKITGSRRPPRWEPTIVCIDVNNTTVLIIQNKGSIPCIRQKEDTKASRWSRIWLFWEDVV